MRNIFSELYQIKILRAEKSKQKKGAVIRHPHQLSINLPI